MKSTPSSRCRSAELPAIVDELSAAGIHASFALNQEPSAAELSVVQYGDQAIPLLPPGGLVRWLGTRDQLHDVMHAMGFSRHFLYASNGPSVGQWWLAHGAGGHLVAGAIKLQDRDDTVGQLRPGEVVEVEPTRNTDILLLVGRLEQALKAQHLAAVPVGRLMCDAGAPV